MAYIGPVSAVPSDLRDLLAKALTESSDYAVVLVVPEDVLIVVNDRQILRRRPNVEFARLGYGWRTVLPAGGSRRHDDQRRRA